MQRQKKDIRQILLRTAHEEFLKFGFKNASMRAIAKRSGVTLSNIYNYFKDKDELFRAVLTPLLEAFDRLAETHNSEDYLTLNVFTENSYQRRMMDEFMSVLKGNEAELKLLLFQSGGSSLENYRDFFTGRQTESGKKYMRYMKMRYPHINDDISTFFIHTMSSWWLTLMGEIVTHDELTEEEIERFLSEYVAFGTAGWKELLKA